MVLKLDFLPGTSFLSYVWERNCVMDENENVDKSTTNRPSLQETNNQSDGYRQTVVHVDIHFVKIYFWVKGGPKQKYPVH